MKDIKTDATLGKKVIEYLTTLGIETPINALMQHESVQLGVSQIMQGLGLSLDNESLQKTPKRVADFFIQELFYGLNHENFPQITFNTNSYNYSDPVIARNVSFKSTCEHHFVTIDGKAYVAYIPKNKVIGLSKLNRIVDFFAKRPQVQERATLQIFHALSFILDTEDIAVFIRAKHHCITMRGVNDTDVDNITYKFGGKFLESMQRQEFLNTISA